MNQATVDVLVAVIPELPGVIVGLLGLLKKYPALTPEMIVALAVEITAQADAGFDSAMAKMVADQKAHP